ncbi:MAG: hypothetical protein KGO02_13020 [Alphaproteobacteria bacterium]|jgi:bacteriorhodopsin|nr:hypothetical protein [Alphaproteobacteria bacterium]
MASSDHPDASARLTEPALWQRAIEWCVVVPLVIVILHVMPQITQGTISWGAAAILGCGSLVLYSLLRATVATGLHYPKTSWGYAARIFAIGLLGAGVGGIVNTIVRSPGLQTALTLTIVIGMVGALPTRPRRRS